MHTKNQEIERLRAVAVIMTTVAHGIFTYFLPIYMYASYTGVDMFFVISGFVVTLSFLGLLPKFTVKDDLRTRLTKATTALKIFYLKRMFRILPLALFWLSAYLFLSLYFEKVGGGGNFGVPEDIFKEVIAVLSGFHNYLVSYGLTGNISHFWSLCVEEQFYAVLPLFLVFFITKEKRFKYIALVLFVLLVVIPFIRDLTLIPLFKFIYAQRYFTLIFGVILALTYNRRTELNNPRNGFLYRHLRAKCVAIYKKFKIVNRYSMPHGLSVVLDQILLGLVEFPKILVSIILILIIWIVPGLPKEAGDQHMHAFGYVVVGLAATVLLYLASREEGWILNIPIANRVLEYIGGRSYCIYLCHFAFIRLRPTMFSLYNDEIPRWVEVSRKGILLQYILMWMGILVVSEICFRIIEQPMIKLGKIYINEKFSHSKVRSKKYNVASLKL